MCDTHIKSVVAVATTHNNTARATTALHAARHHDGVRSLPRAFFGEQTSIVKPSK